MLVTGLGHLRTCASCLQCLHGYISSLAPQEARSLHGWQERWVLCRRGPLRSGPLLPWHLSEPKRGSEGGPRSSCGGYLAGEGTRLHRRRSRGAAVVTAARCWLELLLRALERAVTGEPKRRGQLSIGRRWNLIAFYSSIISRNEEEED